MAGGSARSVGGSSAAHLGGGKGAAGLRIEVRLSELASPPPPAELQAVVSAVEQCLAGLLPRLPERVVPAPGAFLAAGG